MSRAETTVWNLSDAPSKRRLMEHISMLKGLHDVTIKPRRITRSLQANAFYWVSTVTPFAHWLRENYGDESISLEDAHDILKRQILGVRTKQIGDGGEFIELAASTRVLDKWEFANYLEKCAAWLAEFCEIVVLSSELFFEGKQESKRKTA